MSSIRWVVDPSDAPYSVVALFWTTDGISTAFLAHVWGEIFFEKHAAENKLRH